MSRSSPFPLLLGGGLIGRYRERFSSKMYLIRDIDDGRKVNDMVLKKLIDYFGAQNQNGTNNIYTFLYQSKQRQIKVCPFCTKTNQDNLNINILNILLGYLFF